MSGPTIHFKEVGLSLGGVEILSALNLTIEAGEIHCIIGPNGGGKTSLIRSLLGQMPHIGSIEMQWNGNQVTDQTPDQTKSHAIGYVPQFLDFDKSLPITVSDFMAMVCNTNRPVFFGPGKNSRALIESALESVDLQNKCKTRLGSLSGGERQRILFAQALIPEPNLLILDEPMTSMDQRGGSIFLDIIQRLSTKGVTIVWVAHDLQQVRNLADSISCINRTLVYSGPPQAFLDSDEAADLFRYTRRFNTKSIEKNPDKRNTQVQEEGK